LEICKNAYAGGVRARRIALIVLAVTIFLVVSALLARAFSVPNAEQAAVTDLIAAEARGDAAAMLADIRGCAASPRCRGAVQEQASRLRHGGEVQVASYNASAGFSLAGTTGIARIAWTAGGSLPVVQCVEVRRTGNLLSGQRIELLALSPRISGGANCPPKL
jgi:hypothetical protein